MQMKRKRMVLFAAVALSALLLLGACGGVPQEDLDAVQAELASAQAAATTAAAERDQAVTDLEAAATDLEAAVTDLSSQQDSASRLREYLSTANADLASVTTELESVSEDLDSVNAELESVSAELEAALLAGPEEAAADDEGEVVEEEAAEDSGVRQGTTDVSFASRTYTNTLYGYSFQVLEDWTSGTLYAGAYERVGNSLQWNVPALGVYPLGPAEEDPFVYLREELTITYAEMVSETEAVLIDGAAVTVYVALMGDADSGTNVGMTVIVNGELINFTVDWSETWPWAGGGVDMATEILLSLVIDADLME